MDNYFSFNEPECDFERKYYDKTVEKNIGRNKFKQYRNGGPRCGCPNSRNYFIERIRICERLYWERRFNSEHKIAN